MFQSTHPRGVRLAALSGNSANFAVSIHAPTWGATCRIIRQFCQFCGFNPRTHVGCDLGSKEKADALMVSIHAPTWGATQALQDAFPNIVFQSTHPRGVRPIEYTTIDGLHLFQSTHPRGVRHTPTTTNINRNCFNPRTHVGCDISLYRVRETGLCFNPRTHVGCDAICVGTLITFAEFQSTHPRGVRHIFVPS